VAGPPNPINIRVAGVNGLLAQFRDTRFDWRVALDYHWTQDLMTYAQVSTGYKGGGVNPRPFFPEQLDTFNPETLTAYELGFKSTVFNNRMRLNGAVFYNQYKNIQLTLNQCERPVPPFPTPIGAPCAKPSNVGSAHVKGAELEVEFYPVDGLSIDSSLSYLDFHYTFVDPVALTGSSIAPLDMVTPYTPEWKWSGGIQYDFPETSFGMFSARLDASYQSSMYTNATNDTFNLVDSYVLANARLTWRSKEQDWQVSFEVTNLFDKLYYLNIFDQHQATSVGQVTGQPGLPRQWAITLKRNF
jgi:iron complex outermembrane recepter protein